MLYPSSCVFNCLRSPWKRLCRLVVAVYDCMTRHPRSSEVVALEGGHFLIEQWRAIVLRIRCSKSRTSRYSHGLKFGMVGTYNSYFPNVERKGKVTF